MVPIFEWQISLQTCFTPQEAAQQGYMMGPGGQYRANSMPQVYKHYIDGGTGTGPPQRRFKNLEDIVCFKVRPNSRLWF